MDIKNINKILYEKSYSKQYYNKKKVHNNYNMYKYRKYDEVICDICHSKMQIQSIYCHNKTKYHLSHTLL